MLLLIGHPTVLSPDGRLTGSGNLSALHLGFALHGTENLEQESLKWKCYQGFGLVSVLLLFQRIPQSSSPVIVRLIFY